MRHPPGVLVLLDHVTVVGSGVSFATSWTPIPPNFQVEQIVVVCHATNSGTNLNVAAETTWDTAAVAQVGSAIPVTATGVTPQDLSSGLGPLVRLQFAGARLARRLRLVDAETRLAMDTSEFRTRHGECDTISMPAATIKSPSQTGEGGS